MATVVGPQKFAVDSLLRIERKKNAVVFLRFVNDAQRRRQARALEIPQTNASQD
jgi:hypothetical protein